MFLCLTFIINYILFQLQHFLDRVKESCRGGHQTFIYGMAYRAGYFDEVGLFINQKFKNVINKYPVERATLTHLWPRMLRLWQTSAHPSLASTAPSTRARLPYWQPSAQCTESQMGKSNVSKFHHKHLKIEIFFRNEHHEADICTFPVFPSVYPGWWSLWCDIQPSCRGSQSLSRNNFFSKWFSLQLIEKKIVRCVDEKLIFYTSWIVWYEREKS